jgi:geranylgeranyl diphosphate synthase, type I
VESRRPERYSADTVRPSLVLWACAACNGELADALPVAAAFELFDRFLLLHEELADESAATIECWGLGQSLNAGDALYALAFRCLAGDVRNAERRLATARLVAQAVLETIAEHDDDRRTATLMSAALEAGAVIAGAPANVARTFAKAGRLLATAPTESVAAVASCASHSHVSAFEEVARYVARRAA